MTEVGEATAKDTEIEDKYVFPKTHLSALGEPAVVSLLVQRYLPRDEHLVRFAIDFVNGENTHHNARYLQIPELVPGLRLVSSRIRKQTDLSTGDHRYFFTAKTARRLNDPWRIELETEISHDLYRMLKQPYATAGYLRKIRKNYQGKLGNFPITLSVDEMLRIGQEKQDVTGLPFVFSEIEVPSYDQLCQLREDGTLCTFRGLLRKSLLLPPGVAVWKPLSMSRMARDGATPEFWHATQVVNEKLFVA